MEQAFDKMLERLRGIGPEGFNPGRGINDDFIHLSSFLQAPSLSTRTRNFIY